MIEKIMIRNYRIFEEFDLEFSPSMNIIVGDNDAGKSTLLEAINLALTSKIHGNFLAYELTPFHFNAITTTNYINALQEGLNPPPPEMIIELYLKSDPDTAILRGSNNLSGHDAVGIRIRASLNSEFVEEYKNFISEPSSMKLIPTEYYKVEWLGFSGNGITFRSVSARASFIDASSMRLQNGADHHLQTIIKEYLELKERVELSRTYRSAREAFAENQSVKDANKKLGGTKGDVTNRDLSLAIDISQRYTWESSVVAHIDGLPYQFIGNGEQNTLKILLALNRKSTTSQVILIEEPENHLSFASLNMLISKVVEKCKEKQILVTTHSSYVLNKLGLDSLILLHQKGGVRIGQLPNDTQDYFMKLSGYDTLRLVLSRRVILVEGPSDELIVQRAYRDNHDGRMPIEDGIDVINVRGLSFKRFLDISRLLGRNTAVVTDNDGKPPTYFEDHFSEYSQSEFISIHVGEDQACVSLEPQLLAANNLATLNKVLEMNHASTEKLLDFMTQNKTTVALTIFESSIRINMPSYIQNAVNK